MIDTTYAALERAARARLGDKLTATAAGYAVLLARLDGAHVTRPTVAHLAEALQYVDEGLSLAEVLGIEYTRAADTAHRHGLDINNASVRPTTIERITYLIENAPRRTGHPILGDHWLYDNVADRPGRARPGSSGPERWALADFYRDAQEAVASGWKVAESKRNRVVIEAPTGERRTLTVQQCPGPPTCTACARVTREGR